MIPVSNAFKNAIKSDNREIYGYVDIKYQDKPFQTSVTQIPTKQWLVSQNGIINGKKTMDKFATLEENYTLLDNSFIVWNDNIVFDNGYISNNTFENISDTTIIITNSSTTLSTKGISIYFKENLPFDFTVTFTDINDEEIIDTRTNNQSLVYQYIFEEEIIIKSVELNISRMEFPKNRLRIAYIDFNLSDFYQNEDLINFNVTEELDLLMESLPINTCEINLNNYPDENGGNKFDPINPKGIVKYLDNTVTIEPFIGILTEETGIEYVPMGVFYLDEWSSDIDGNVTLNGKSLMNKLKDKDMIWSNAMFSDTVYTPALATMIETSANISCDFPQYSMPLTNWSNIHTNLFEYLKYISPCLIYNNRPNITDVNEYRKLYVNRYNTLVLDDIPITTVDSISRNQLINDVEYITNNPIQIVQADYTTYSTSYDTTATIIIDTMFTLTKEEQYVWFKMDKYIAHVNTVTGTVMQGTASVTYINNNMKLILLKITGTIGSIIKIECNAEIPNKVNQHSYNAIFTDANVKNGDKITLSFGNCEIPNFDAIQKPFFTIDKPYKVNAQTMGDPSLEIGDSVNIQTRYTDIANGYKTIIITRQQFTFDGGLQCYLEGVGE